MPACPITAGTVSGVIQAGDVVGPNAQGIAPGELAELVAAIHAGAAYANMHTNKVPSGEIRGQIKLADDWAVASHPRCKRTAGARIA